jgi:hypothetical protein
MTSPNSRNKALETDWIETNMGKFLNTEFKTAVLRKLDRLQENIEKCFKTLTEKYNKDMKIIFKTKRILELKNILSKNKNGICGTNCRIDQPEVRISDLKDRLF